MPTVSPGSYAFAGTIDALSTSNIYKPKLVAIPNLFSRIMKVEENLSTKIFVVIKLLCKSIFSSHQNIDFCLGCRNQRCLKPRFY